MEQVQGLQLLLSLDRQLITTALLLQLLFEIFKVALLLPDAVLLLRHLEVAALLGLQERISGHVHLLGESVRLALQVHNDCVFLLNLTHVPFLRA